MLAVIADACLAGWLAGRLAVQCCGWLIACLPAMLAWLAD